MLPGMKVMFSRTEIASKAYSYTNLSQSFYISISSIEWLDEGRYNKNLFEVDSEIKVYFVVRYLKIKMIDYSLNCHTYALGPFIH